MLTRIDLETALRTGVIAQVSKLLEVMAGSIAYTKPETASAAFERGMQNVITSYALAEGIIEKLYAAPKPSPADDCPGCGAKQGTLHSNECPQAAAIKAAIGEQPSDE